MGLHEEERSCVRRPSLWWASARPELPDRDCLIQLPLSSRSTAPGRSPFSTITHANGTACNISSLRKPFPAVSSTELSLYLSLAASLSLTPSRHVSPSCLPVHLSLFCLPLCVSSSGEKKKKKKRPPLVVPLECWVGEKYRLQPELFPFFQQSFHYAYHFQVQHQTLEGWQSARGKIISVVLQAYLKMHFNTFVASQPVSTATRYIKLQNTSNFITFHIQLT